MPSVNAPCCERCWIDAHGEFDMDTLGYEGSCREIAVQVLRRCKTPTMLIARDREIERCHFCGGWTIVGIYIRTET